MGGAVLDLSKAVQELGEKITGEAVQLAHDIDASVEVKVELVNDRPAEATPARRRPVRRVGDRRRRRRRGPIAGALLGSVTYQVVHRSTRPVVVVPSPEVA